MDHNKNADLRGINGKFLRIREILKTTQQISTILKNVVVHIYIDTDINSHRLIIESISSVA